MSKITILLIILIIVLIFIGLFLFFQKEFKTEQIIIKNKNMKIESPVFQNNQQIPSKYTCDGENVNPPLQFLDIPEATKSLVLIVDDPDAPGGVFVHWVVFNIDPEIRSIAENSVPDGVIEGMTSFGNKGYGGPCPPFGTHRYFFKLYALDKKLDLNENASKKEIETAMASHVLAQAELIGLYQRK